MFIILSGQTEEYNYRRTFRRLRRRYRTWAACAAADEQELYEVIAHGGLGRKKARQLVALFRAVRERFGVLDLKALREMPDDQAYSALVSLPGIGPKSARCVMLYALDRAAFPVDTHVWRVLDRVGCVDSKRKQPTSREQAQLEAEVPLDLRYELHVNLVQHGRRLCQVSPRCVECPVAPICQFSQRSREPGRIEPAQVLTNARPSPAIARAVAPSRA